MRAALLDFLDHNRTPSPKENSDERDNHDRIEVAGWEVEFASACPTGRVSGAEQGSRHVESRRLSDGARTVSGICCYTAIPNPRRRCPHSKSSRQGLSTACEGESAEAQRDRGQGDDPAGASDPALGSKKLDAITTEDVQRLKQRWRPSAEDGQQRVDGAKRLLRKAVEWDVITGCRAPFDCCRCGSPQ